MVWSKDERGLMDWMGQQERTIAVAKAIMNGTPADAFTPDELENARQLVAQSDFPGGARGALVMEEVEEEDEDEELDPDNVA